MRYIGSKRLLLEEIDKVISENIKWKPQIFCDIFSWTWVVSEYMKKKYTIISNDILYFSYVMQRASIMENIIPDFNVLNNYLNECPFEYLNNKKITLSDFNENPFIYNNYSPNEKSDRMYLTNDNSLKIDFIRQELNKWKKEELIQDNEYYYILACLIHAIPFYSNITWTYWAYLKNWDKRALKKLEINKLNIYNNFNDNIVYNEDSNNLINQISWDILYLDPPYNSRQYLPNYHLLETIAKYDNPEIYWKTWMRPYKNVKSKYCVKSEVLSQFNNLIEKANFKHVILSYSTEWLMSEKEISDILCNHWKKESYRLYKIPYRRYKHTKWDIQHNLEELLFYIEKK